MLLKILPFHSIDASVFHPFIIYFKHSSDFYKNIKHNFEELYNIKDIYENDLDALHSRISFVQQREASSLPLFLRV